MRIPFSVDIRGTLRRNADPRILEGAMDGFEQEMDMYFSERLEEELRHLAPSAERVGFSKEAKTIVNGQKFHIHYDFEFDVEGAEANSELKREYKESMKEVRAVLADVQRLLNDFAFFLDEFSDQFKGRPTIRIRLDEGVLEATRRNTRRRIVGRTLRVAEQLPEELWREIADFAEGRRQGRGAKRTFSIADELMDGGRRRRRRTRRSR